MVEQHSLQGWDDALRPKSADGKLSQSDAMLLCLLDIRNFTLTQAQQGHETMQAAQHTEGMLGAIDQFAAGVAERSGIPYASSGAVREALDAQRDERRRIAAGHRQAAEIGEQDA